MFRNNWQKSDEAFLNDYRKTPDIAVLGVLYDRYLSLVYGVCLKYFKNEQDAKDAVMQIFELLPEKILQHDIHNFRSWLYVVCKNYCLMELRKMTKDKTVVFRENFMEYTDDFHLDKVMEDERQIQLLSDCMAALPLRQRETIELFFIKELSYKEISELTGNDLGSVKSFIQNGKRNLKICLEKKRNNDR